MSRTVCVVVTARATYSRIRTALTAIRDHPELSLQLVVAGSVLLERYGTAVNNIEADGFDIDCRVFSVIEGENLTSMAKTTGITLLELTTVFENLQPDVVVTVADRYETIATAIAASYMNIPLAHVQGGEVTGSIDEKVRHAVTKLADVHFTCTEVAGDRVRRMGEAAGDVFVTGCPSIDLAALVAKEPGLDFDPYERYGGVGEAPAIDGGYIVVLQHPVTTEYSSARYHVEQTLHAILDLGKPTFWFWPNPDAGSDGTASGIRSFREKYAPKHIHFFKNMAPPDFLRILVNAGCLVGNSSVGIRESSFLGVPVVNIGSRQRGRERGANVTDVEYAAADIRLAIERQVKAGHYPRSRLYGDGCAGRRIADLLATVALSIDKKLTL